MALGIKAFGLKADGVAGLMEGIKHLRDDGIEGMLAFGDFVPNDSRFGISLSVASHIVMKLPAIRYKQLLSPSLNPLSVVSLGGVSDDGY